MRQRNVKGANGRRDSVDDDPLSRTDVLRDRVRVVIQQVRRSIDVPPPTVETRSIVTSLPTLERLLI